MKWIKSLGGIKLGLMSRSLSDNNDEGSRFRDLGQVLPSLSRGQLKTLLKELKQDNKIHCVGSMGVGSKIGMRILQFGYESQSLKERSSA